MEKVVKPTTKRGGKMEEHRGGGSGTTSNFISNIKK